MTILQAIILGIVEGITEYLPISSTGHLIITQFLLGMQKSTALDAFSVCIQGGAIVAVAGLYFKRIKQMAMGLLGKDPAGLRILTNIIIAFIPAVIIGLSFGETIKTYLFNAQTVAITWFIGGIVILLFVRWQKKMGKDGQGSPLESMTWKDALAVGLLQCLAMCPGVSRSLSTMLGGLFKGLSIAAAVEFSFLLGLLTLTGATFYDAYRYGGEMVQELGILPIIVGTFAAWISAVIAVRWLVSYLQKHSLSIFGWYRIAASMIMLGFILTGARLIDTTPQDDSDTVQESIASPKAAPKN